ncbi:hypothetical protein GW846_02845 [Candidatus Gracilibacteria bacterium]|nr:hypothetical protein [Candidatus Gracilibacteria bacterium]
MVDIESYRGPHNPLNGDMGFKKRNSDKNREVDKILGNEFSEDKKNFSGIVQERANKVRELLE